MTSSLMSDNDLAENPIGVRLMGCVRAGECVCVCVCVRASVCVCVCVRTIVLGRLAKVHMRAHILNSSALMHIGLYTLGLSPYRASSYISYRATS